MAFKTWGRKIEFFVLVTRWIASRYPKLSPAARYLEVICNPTWADMHSLMFVSCFSMYNFTFDNNSKIFSREILKLILYISRSSLVHSTKNLFYLPNVSRLITHGWTNQRSFIFFPFSKMCWHSFVNLLAPDFFFNFSTSCK